MERLFTTKDLCKELKLQRYQFSYLVEQLILPESKLRLGGRRIFSEEEVKAIKEIIERRQTKQGKE